MKIGLIRQRARGTLGVWPEVFKKAIYPFHCCDEETFLGRKKPVVAISVQKLEPVILLIAITVSEFIQSLTDILSISPAGIDKISITEWDIFYSLPLIQLF